MESTENIEEGRAAIVNLAEAKRQRTLTSREGKLKQLERAYDDFERTHRETRGLISTRIERIDENGTIHTETLPGLSGGAQVGDCLITTNIKATRPRLLALELALNKCERVILAMKRSEGT